MAKINTKFYIFYLLQILRRDFKWDITETKSHISNAFALWKTRSKMEWNLDISIITNAGISVNEILGSNERKKISHETINRINKK